MSEQKFVTLEDGSEVPAEDYMMAYAPFSVVRRVCEPALIPINSVESDRAREQS